MKAVVAMPEDTPAAMLAECLAYGAEVILVKGLIDNCGKVIRAGAAAFGWTDVSTLREPYRAEGKKTMGLEIVEQLGTKWQKRRVSEVMASVAYRDPRRVRLYGEHMRAAGIPD